MGKEKGGFLSPKAIANRIKSKGLQKLRWYCQMCQKQCRDENGFKCHTMSESHQRQLLLFADNPDKFLDTFSNDFLDGYTELLRRRFGTRRVHANVVYQEYIHDKDHIHMNSTQWETLTEFVKWLGREGKCTVDETEKGWFVQYIDRDPEVLKRQEVKEKMTLDDEEKTAKFIAQQIERAAQNEKDVPDAEYTELIRENEEEKVTFSLGGTSKKAETTSSAKVTPSTNPLTKNTAKKKEASEKPGQKRKAKSALEEIREREEQERIKQKKLLRKDYWLHKGIVVKVVTKRLGEKYYKKKAVIKDVEDKYTAVIKMIDSGDKLKVDQTHLETVIPAVGKPVLILNDMYRTNEATLLSINEDQFSCTVKINKGPSKDAVVENVPYEDISKLYVPS